MFGRIKQRERKAAEALAAEVRAQREATLELVERYEERTRKTVQAIEAASKAREQRDEYRRVLAAAIANERRQEIHVASLEAELRELKDAVLEEARARGAAEASAASALGRVTELEGELRAAAARAERDRGDAADRAWAEREAAREEVVQLVTRSQRDAADLTAEVRRALTWMGLQPQDASGAPVHDPVMDSVGRQRGRLLAGLAVGAALVGLSLTPMAVLAALGAERAAYIHLASGLSPLQLILLVLGAFGLAVLLYSRALNDLRPREDSGERSSALAAASSVTVSSTEPPVGAVSEPAGDPEAELSSAERQGAPGGADDVGVEGDGVTEEESAARPEDGAAPADDEASARDRSN